MDFSNLPSIEEADRILGSKENMANLNDLGLGGARGGAPVVNLKAVGESVVGVIEDIDTAAPVFDFTSKQQKFWVGNKPQPLSAEVAEATGAKPVHQIMITVLKDDGTKARIPFNSKDEREALKSGIEEAGGEINIGDTIGKKLVKREGNIKTHAVKVIPAS